jgi:threonine dehydratase
MVNYLDILAAEKRLRPFLPLTPLEYAPDMTPNTWLKLEIVNPTHSFKIRGALNALLMLSDDEKTQGIVAASSGNHAQGVAYAARQVGTTARIYTPRHTPHRKIQGVKRFGADAVLFGAVYDEAEAEAQHYARQNMLTFISPYNDARVIAGAGTIGLEILAQLPTTARVIVPVSGGGLISGIATAIKATRPEVTIIGVNALSAPAMYNRFYGTHYPEQPETLAEALSGDIETGAITIPIVQSRVDDMVLVNEDQISAAMRWMLDTQGWLVEGGGAVGIAAVLHGIIAQDERPTVVVISGSNVDVTTLRHVLEA